jgi:uncharacterized coiled-coil protein SlyX
MSKMPSFDDLKKVGGDLMGKAKSMDVSGMVDKIKSGIDQVATNKQAAAMDIGDDGLKSQLQLMQAAIDELTIAQTSQSTALRKLQNQLSTLTKTLQASAAPAVIPVIKNEEDKKL